MADEYILRSIAIAKLTALQVTDPFATIADAKRVLADMAAADVAPVVHARWERVRSNWYCTGCHKGYRITNGAPTASNYAYCPNCNAKMDGGNGSE